MATCAVIAHITQRPGTLFARFLSRPPLLVIGRMSFSVYLWQQLFTTQEADGLRRAGLTAFPINLIATLLFATLSYYLRRQGASD